jgi:hypothetical protein
MNKFIYQLTYGVKKHYLQILVTFSLIIGFFPPFNHSWVSKKENYEFLQWLDPIVGIITFFTAFFIWMIQTSREWKDELNERISFSYRYQGRVIMHYGEIFYYEQLDFRTFGQQIGSQISGGRLLNIEPFIKKEQPKICFDYKNREYYKHYLITFFLKELPENSFNPEEANDNFRLFNEGGRLNWTIIINEDDSFTIEKTWEMKPLRPIRVA